MFWVLFSAGLVNPKAQQVKNLPAMQQKTQEMWVQSLGWDDPLEEEMATHSNSLAWRIQATVPVGSQRVRHNWATEHKRSVSPSPILGASSFGMPLSPACQVTTTWGETMPFSTTAGRVARWAVSGVPGPRWPVELSVMGGVFCSCIVQHGSHCHMWLPSTWNGDSVIDSLNF